VPLRDLLGMTFPVRQLGAELVCSAVANIRLTAVPNANLLTVEGDLTAEEIKAVVRKHYGSFSTPNIIWDLSSGTMSGLTREQFQEVAKLAREHLPPGNRKVAFVGSTDTTFAILCMYTAIAVLNDVPAEYSAFHTLEAAIRWIAEE
jgi:hypothetical protein